jgi:co-chaperonin GroES (HSP10)
MLMEHDQDPKKVLMDAIAPYLDDIELMGAEFLAATYQRPEKTKGGLFLPDGQGHVRGEDVYEGKVQLVVKLGAQAFQDTDAVSFSIKPKVGDWVLIRVGDSFPLILGSTACRLIMDERVRAIIKRPDIVL